MTETGFSPGGHVPDTSCQTHASKYGAGSLTDNSKAKQLSRERWFARSAVNMISEALHGEDERLRVSEGQFVNRLILHLLDAERADPDYAHSSALSFYGFCQRNIRRSYAQILQDLWVLYMLDEKQGGYFVEFGACDGQLLSNTRLLEEAYDWKGLLAEPNPVWHDALRQNRTADISTCCVAASSGETIDFISTDKMPELSRIADIVPDDVHEKNGNRTQQTVYSVETISLLDLLVAHNAPAEIDYLSIDTEGSEYEILRDFDFDAYSFRVITVEHAGEELKREKIRKLLESKGYHRWMVELTRWDDW
jgi:FkbM family methyltransferase